MENETVNSLAENARRFFGECGLFRGLGPDERKLLLARVGVRSFAPGETIFTRGSPGGNMIAVLRGSVRIGVNSAEGRGIVLAILLIPLYMFSPGELAPHEDQSFVFGAIDVPANATLEQTNQLVRNANGLVDNQARATLDSAQKSMASLERSSATIDQLLNDNRAAINGGLHLRCGCRQGSQFFRSHILGQSRRGSERGHIQLGVFRLGSYLS